MENNTYNSIISASPRLLKPIVRILLSSGLTFKQFSRITRKLFVEVASEDYGIKGRKTNASRVSIMTGISRSEVTKLRKQIEEEPETEYVQTTLSNASRILTAWHTDKRFLNPDGSPKRLPVNSDSETSFSDLMVDYGGDLPQTAMLKELMKAESVRKNDDDTVTVLRRDFMPPNFDIEHLLRACSVISDLANTTYYNLHRESDKPSWFEGRATNAFMNEKQLRDFQHFLEKRGQAFLEEVDNWLSENETKNDSTHKQQTIRLGTGVYFINGPE